MILYYFLISVMPMVNHPIWGGKAGALTIFEWMGLVCLFYAVVHRILRGGLGGIFSTLPARSLLALFGVALVSAITIHIPGTGYHPLINYTSGLAIYFITVAVVDSVQRLRWTLLVLIGSYAWASAHLIREWQLEHQIVPDFRPGWLVGDNNYFSATAIFAVVLSFHLLRGKRPRWERFYCLGCLAITLTALTLCASRGAFLGLGVALLMAAWRTVRRGRNLAVVCALLATPLLLLPMSPLTRVLHPLPSDEASVQFHLDAWAAGMDMFAGHPLTGVGLGNFKPMMPRYRAPGVKIDSVAHNAFIEVAAETGLLGIALFLLIFISSYRMLGRILRSSEAGSFVRETSLGLQVALAGFSIAACFVSAEYDRSAWLWLGFIASPVLVASRHRSAPEESSNDRPNKGAIPAQSEVPSGWTASLGRSQIENASAGVAR